MIWAQDFDFVVVAAVAARLGCAYPFATRTNAEKSSEYVLRMDGLHYQSLIILINYSNLLTNAEKRVKC